MPCNSNHRRSLFFLFILFSFCTIAQVPPGKANGQPDSAAAYFIYKPRGFEAQKKYPLVIFLDPVARGNYPLNLYARAADSMGILLAGSRTSRNFDPAGSEESVVTILHEINDQYQIDTAMVFLAGFSGGGRAASSIAADHPAIKGVISCGAGLAEPGKFGVERKIPFAGIIGNRDMNFEEMVALQQRLEQINNPNIFIYNETGHQWPPMESFGAALDWIMCVINYPGVHGFDQEIWRAARAEKDSGRLYLSWLTAKELKKIPGLEKTADSFLLSLARQDGFKNDEKEFFTALEDERTFMDEFTIVFNQAVFTLAPLESTDVFKAKASKLDKWVNSRKKYYRLSALRCRDLCWRLCAEYYGQFVADKNYTQADKLAVISAFFQQSPMKLKRFEKTNQ